MFPLKRHSLQLSVVAELMISEKTWNHIYQEILSQKAKCIILGMLLYEFGGCKENRMY